MDVTQFLLIACASIIIGIGIPAGLYYMFRQETRSSFIQIVQKTASEMRNPLRKDQDSMEELSRRVAELKNKSARSDSPPEIEERERKESEGS
jgi:hypothetical protein